MAADATDFVCRTMVDIRYPSPGCQIVADEVAAADVDLDIKIFPSKSLFKPREQYKPLSRGQLDMTVLPLSYAGGQQPAYNLTLMPGLVKNHDHAARLNESPSWRPSRRSWRATT